MIFGALSITPGGGGGGNNALSFIFNRAENCKYSGITADINFNINYNKPRCIASLPFRVL